MSTPFTRATERFMAKGIDLNSPLDAVRPNYYPVLENVRSYIDGIIQPRQGVSSIANPIANQTPCHSVRRLNDPISGNAARIVGSGTGLAWLDGASLNTPHTATYNGSNVAYSDGNPLIITPFRPDQAVSPFAYIATTKGSDISGGGGSPLRQLKINRSGTVHQWGVYPPITPPTVDLSAGVGVGGGAITDLAGATADGTVATGAANKTRVDDEVVTVKYIFDNGTGPGKCSCVPSALTDIGIGMVLNYNPDGLGVGLGYADARVSEVYIGGAATTIAAINYENGTTGLCVVAPTRSTPEMVKNAVVSVGATPHRYRIISSVKGPDGNISIRIDTGANTEVVGAALQVVGSYRTLFESGSIGTTLAQNDPIEAIGQSATFAPSGSNFFGYLYVSGPFDLTRIPVQNGLFVSTGVYLADEDYFHISIFCANWSNVTGGRVVFNVDPTENPSWVSGQAYSLSKNFYYRNFSPSDFVPESQGQQTAVNSANTIINRTVIDRGFGFHRTLNQDQGGAAGEVGVGSGNAPSPVNEPVEPIGTISPPESPRVQAGTGNNQWSEIRFKKSDCMRVGNKSNGDWSSVRHIIFEFTVTASTVIAIDSLTSWGGYRPDIGSLGGQYQYRYRYRVSTTGARSNWSPPSLNGVIALRQQVSVITSAPFNAPEVDRVDIERFGGALTNWTYVGTINASSGIFTDNYGDEDIAGNASISEGDTNFQPWPVIGAPVSGTLATSGATSAGVSGTYVRDSGTNFNKDWAKGTPITIDGIPTFIRKVFSTSLLEIDDSLGSQSATKWEITQPTIAAQILPAFWIWNDTGFACGDTNNPGVLYFTNGNDIDGTHDVFTLEITSPSEPLMNGCSFNGKNYVWSSERMFEIENLGLGNYLAIPVPGNKGMIGRWGLTHGERIWYVGRDGIYQTGGGDSVSITDETLMHLFKTEGNQGITINGFNPPDFTVPNALRLSYYDGYLYFIYKDTSGAYRCLTYTVRDQKPGWWPDVYSGQDGAIRGVTYIYGEEGQGVHSLLACGNNATTAKLYQITGTSDDTGPIACHVRTQYFDGQDRRAEKRWGDFVLDADPNNTTLNLVSYINAGTSSQLTLAPATMTGNGRQQQIVDVSSGGDPTADYSRNMTLDIQWSSTAATPQLFLWEPSYTIRPETTDLRSTTWDDCGVPGDKFFQGIQIDADTNNIVRTIQVEYDGLSTNIGDTLTVQHNGRITKAYPFHPAFIAGSVRLHPIDSADTWKLYNRPGDATEWVFQPEPPLGDRWESQQTSLGIEGFLHMKAAYVTLRSNSIVTLTITRTDDGTAFVYTIPSTANTRKRQYLPFNVIKGKAFIFVFTSGTAFRLYKDDTTLLVKPWASEDAFANRNPFGARHGSGAVTI